MKGKTKFLINTNLSKSFISLLIFLSFILLSSCSAKNTDSSKISIVCTAFSQYDFVKEIVGENKDKFDIIYLFENGTDVHSFETTIVTESKIKILSSDVFIYNGGESDEWAKDIIKDSSMNSDCKIISLIDCISSDHLIKTNHSEHNHTQHNHSEESDEKENHENYDEHVWLSIENAKIICNKICEAISVVDVNNKAMYEKNLELYIEKLDSLKNRFLEKISNLSNPFVVIADRFPFVYLLNEFNISYSAAFSGCTAETDATFENVLELSNDVKNHNLNSIIILENSNTDISQAIISNSGLELKVLKMNSLQSVSRKDIDNGITFITAMEHNFNTLSEAMKN